MYFTFYNIDEAIDFKNKNKIGHRPVRTQNKFHSQFQLNTNKYIDNNNYLRPNSVKT